MPEERNITEVTLDGGTVVPADKVVCQKCGTLDLNTDFELIGWLDETGPDPQASYQLTCTAGHQWTIMVALERPK